MAGRRQWLFVILDEKLQDSQNEWKSVTGLITRVHWPTHGEIKLNQA